MSTEDVIAQAQAPETFDVLSFLEGTAYPTETVTIYTDARSATALLKANQKRLDMDQSELTQDYTDINAEIADLTEKVKKSVLSFDLRGLPPGLVKEIYNVGESAEEDDIRSAEDKLIAATIVSVTSADGKRDSRVWDEKAVEAFRRYLKEAEFGKLVQGVVNVNFNAAVFDEATDAGFLGRSTDLAE